MTQGILDADRWIGPPAGIGRTSRHEKAGDQQGAKDRHQPERHRIETREGHIGGADHGGDQQVVEPVQHRKDEQEQHDRSVHRVDAVVHGAIHQIGRRRDQLTTNDHGQQATDQEEEKGRDNVLDTNHLGIGVEAEITAPRGLFGGAGREGGGGHRAQASCGRVLDPGTFTWGGGAGGTVAQPGFFSCCRAVNSVIASLSPGCRGWLAAVLSQA